MGLPLDRYEPRTKNALAHAQIDIPEDGDKWDAAFDCIRSIHDPIQRLVSEGLVGLPRLDVAAGLSSSALSASLAIPTRVAAAAGETGMDIDSQFAFGASIPNDGRPQTND